MRRSAYMVSSGAHFKGFTFQPGFIFARMGKILLATSTWTCNGYMFIYASADNGRSWNGDWVCEDVLARWNRHLGADVFVIPEEEDD